MFVWDEKKRLANLEKHKLDFVDASEVYNHQHKYTTKSTRHGEERNADIAVVEYRNACVTLIYVERDGDIQSSPIATPPETSGNSMQNLVSQSDWEYVRRMQATDAPIPYNPDDDDELYDPNDEEAVRAFWMQGVREGRVTRGVGKDAVVLKPEDFGWEK